MTDLVHAIPECEVLNKNGVKDRIVGHGSEELTDQDIVEGVLQPANNIIEYSNEDDADDVLGKVTAENEFKPYK